MQEEEKEQQEKKEDEAVEEVEAQNPADAEPPQRSGCLKGCLTPIIAIFLILIIAILIGYSKRDSFRVGLLKRIIANTHDHVLGELPEGMDEKAIEAEFETVRTALKEGRIDEEVLTEAIKEYQDAVQERPSQEQKKEDINKLIEGMKAAIRESNE